MIIQWSISISTNAFCAYFCCILHLNARLQRKVQPFLLRLSSHRCGDSALWSGALPKYKDKEIRYDRVRPIEGHFSRKILYMFPWGLFRDNSNHAQHQRPRQPLTPFLFIKLYYPVTGGICCRCREQSPPKQPQYKQMSQSKHTLWAGKSEMEQMICLA